MTFATDLAAAYAAQGESVTVDGTACTAFFDAGYLDALGVAGKQVSLRCVSSSITGAAIGDTVVRSGASYTVREIQTIYPDELETRLILEAV